MQKYCKLASKILILIEFVAKVLIKQVLNWVQNNIDNTSSIKSRLKSLKQDYFCLCIYERIMVN